VDVLRTCHRWQLSEKSGSTAMDVQVRRLLHTPILEPPVRATTLLNRLLGLPGAAMVDPQSWQVEPGGGACGFG
jgi:hypothetical protein